MSVLARCARDAGFVDVAVKQFKMPVGPWPKDDMLAHSGAYNMVAFYEGFYGSASGCGLTFWDGRLKTRKLCSRRCIRISSEKACLRIYPYDSPSIQFLNVGNY